MLRSDLAHFVGNETKIKILFKIKPPLCAQVFRYANGRKKGMEKIK